MNDSQANDYTTCVVCFKNVLYFSIGECDHPVCFECSTRMRVLCQQNECPICRQDLSRVVFTETIRPYKELRNKVFSDRLFERQFKIGFCSQEIKNAYDSLLENRCKLCATIAPFRTFGMLSDHMRKVHERHFCDLCVEHLNIFTSERKCYTRQELAHHRRKGDVDDTSHRGHPLCEFCEKRFMDADELYRHLRKDHLYCHLCDADGRNLYYDTHTALAQHFRSDHYLCEEGECTEQYLTAVFRSEIDLKAHRATVHARGMARGAARQARTLELQFNITPHPVAQRPPRDRERDREREPVEEPRAPPPVVAIDTRSDEQFPRLSAAPAHPNLVLAAPSRSYKGADGLTRNDKNFPALDGGPSRPPPARGPAPPTVAATLLRNSKPSVSIQLHGQASSASNFRLTPAATPRVTVPSNKTTASSFEDDFPQLSLVRDDHPSIGAATNHTSKVASINTQEMVELTKSRKSQSASQQKKKPQSGEAFPALSAGAAPSSPPRWITVSKQREPRPTPTPPTPKPGFNAVADFPTLPLNAKPKPKKQPVQQPHPAPPQNDRPTKKEKKKLNAAKKENIAETPHVNGVIDKKIAQELSYGASVNNNQIPDADKKIKTGEKVKSEKNKNEGNGDFALAAKDYPPLNARTENVPSKRVPPGFRARPPCDGMTFTNSAGQTFSAPLHTYITPPLFEQRNRALVRQFAEALGSAAAVEEFKVASRAFRDSIISADEFYQHCRDAMGPKLDEVFPELVALLPDIRKQQELMVGRETNITLIVCSTCGQLLRVSDGPAHETAHWPPLASR